MFVERSAFAIPLALGGCSVSAQRAHLDAECDIRAATEEKLPGLAVAGDGDLAAEFLECVICRRLEPQPGGVNEGGAGRERAQRGPATFHLVVLQQAHRTHNG